MYDMNARARTARCQAKTSNGRYRNRMLHLFEGQFCFFHRSEWRPWHREAPSLEEWKVPS